MTDRPITPQFCDFRVGLDVPRRCPEPPTYRCICERCSSEGEEGTFYACAAHRADVEDRHQRIYGPSRAVVWQHPVPAVRPAPCSPTEFAYSKVPAGSLEQLLERPYKPPELFICEEVELGSGYHTLWAVGGPERDWCEPYKKSSHVQYRSRVVRVPYPPEASR